MNSRLTRFAVVAGILFLASCRSPVPSDENDSLQQAKPSPLDTRIIETISCDDREGDCQDWFVVSVPASGTLKVWLRLTPVEDQSSELQLALLDAGGITLLQTRNGGRIEAGLRGQVEKGDHYVWLSPDDSADETEFGYEMLVTFEPDNLATPIEAAPESARAGCIELIASPDLNFYAGQPHVLTLYVYPLASDVGFRDMNVETLVSGQDPPSMAGDVRLIMLTPGQRMTLQETFQASAQHVGLVADYYLEAGSSDGQRMLVVPARCGKQSPVVRLEPGEMLRER
jgi:type VI secretion system VasD/TssJ family lipoprotein